MSPLWLGMAALTSPALAQEPARSESEPALDEEDPLEELRGRLEQVRAEAEAARDEAETARANRADLEQLIADAIQLLAPGEEGDRRAEAAERLATRGGPEAMELLRAAIQSRSPAIQRSALVALVHSLDPVATDVAADALLEPELSTEVRLLAATVLGDLYRPAAGEALYEATATGELPREVEARALELLEARYPEILAQRGALAAAEERGARLSIHAGSALAGSIALSSVGVWGQSEAAITVGALGGAGIGLGAGGLWHSQAPRTRGQALRYMSDIGWGVTGSVLASETLELDPEGAAALRLVGTGLGTATGVWFATQRDPRPADVGEQQLAGYLGMMTAHGIAESARLATLAPSRDPSPVVKTTPAASLLGGGVGLAVGRAVSESWALSSSEAALAGIAAAEGAWVAGWLPVAIRSEPSAALVSVGAHGAAIATLVGTELISSDASTLKGSQVSSIGWGLSLGNALGAGLPLLAGQGERVTSAIMLPAGLAGGVAGGLADASLELDAGDRAALALGVPVATGQGLLLGSALNSDGLLDGGGPIAGLGLTAGATTGIALTALSPVLSARPRDVGFVGAAGGWGAYHGVLIPIALDVQGSPSGLLYSTVIASDVFLAAGAVAVAPQLGGLDARRTVLPQVVGVGGATLGSLGAFMVSAEGVDAVRGALVGSTVGLVVGSLIETQRSPPQPAQSARLVLPGEWRLGMRPVRADDGSILAQLQVQATKW